ncbi:MAG: glycosyltransferase family 2 protein [Hungatella sp.]|nr:glycosyltransferase family 2 protein [Hungatella sp.]
MTLDVLLSAMHLDGYHYIDSLNITGNCVIINQCNQESQQVITDNNRHITYIETTQRGLSKSRNMAIDHSQADICIFCDNDVEYSENYEHLILEEYDKHPEYDIIVFHVESEINPVPCYPSPRKIHYLTSGKIVSVEISFKRKSIQNIRLNEHIGAGTKYHMGEENAFLYECLRQGLKIYYVPQKIARLRHEPSTWYSGFNKDFFIARGASFHAMTSRYSMFLAAQYAVRKYKLYRKQVSFFQAIRYMLEGRKSYMAEVTDTTNYV